MVVDSRIVEVLTEIEVRNPKEVLTRALTDKIKVADKAVASQGPKEKVGLKPLNWNSLTKSHLARQLIWYNINSSLFLHAINSLFV